MAEVTDPAVYFGANYEVLAATTGTTRSNADEPCLVIPLGVPADAVTVGPRLITEAEAAEGVGNGGSAKDVVFGLVDHIVEAHSAIPVVDRPANMTISRRLSYDAQLNPTRTYTFTFTMAPDPNPSVKPA